MKHGLNPANGCQRVVPRPAISRLFQGQFNPLHPPSHSFGEKSSLGPGTIQGFLIGLMQPKRLKAQSSTSKCRTTLLDSVSSIVLVLLQAVGAISMT